MSMNKIKFIESSHEYLTEDGEDLISVSKFTERFKEKVNWDEVAKKCAIKLTKQGSPSTKQDVLDKWKNKGNITREIGTLFHSIKEREILQKETHEFYGIECEKESGYYEHNNKMSIPINELKNNTVYPELMIYDLGHMICGQSDKVIVVNKEINIWDYKGLALDTFIPTRDGFKLMADIIEGDTIFDGDGRLTTVKHVSEIHYNPCYRITFDTGDEILCDHEHKWIISRRMYKDAYKNEEKRTEELYSLFKSEIPIRLQCSSISMKKIDLPVDPYVLGAWLGDGNRHYGRITNMNPKLWKEIENRGYILGSDISGGSSGRAEDRTIFGLSVKLKQLNLLKNKHIPDIYLRSSYRQRLDLLRGFMDTDGHYNRTRDRCVMGTTRKWQAEAMMQLVSSLGWKPTLINTYTSGFGKVNIPVFLVNFNAPENPFLTRNEDYKYISSEKSKFRYVRNIEKIETIATKCISVTSPSHTYLVTKNYIKTHNTDAEISFQAFSNKWVKPRKLLPPLSHLDDCNGNIYSIKMSLYMYMLWKANKGRFKPGELILEHFTLKRDEDKIPILENGIPVILRTEQIELPYRKQEVEAMLKTLKTK